MFVISWSKRDWDTQQSLPDDLIQRQRNLNQTEIVECYVDRHEESNANNAFPLFFKCGRVEVFEWFSQHERQQNQETEEHVAGGQQQRK